MSDEYDARIRFLIRRSLDHIEQGRLETVKIRYKTSNREIVIEIHGEERLTYEEEKDE